MLRRLANISPGTASLSREEAMRLITEVADLQGRLECRRVGLRALVEPSTARVPPRIERRQASEWVVEIEAFVCGALVPTTHDRDLILVALNERFVLGRRPWLPYAEDADNAD